MSTVIRVPQNIYTRLEQHAKGFDTPANVIEKLLNNYEGVENGESNSTLAQNVTKKRDTTKYNFDNNQFGKSKLVLAIIEDYVNCNPGITFDNLLTTFPKHIQGSTGVFNKLKEVQEKYKGSNQKRHFIQDSISLKDCDIVVSTEWGIGNINNFIEQAKSIGYSIEPSKS